MDPSSARWIGGAHVTSYPNTGLNSVAGRSLGEKISQGKSLPANMAKVGGRGGMSGYSQCSITENRRSPTISGKC